MTKPLSGIRVVEVAMWAFVPSAGGMLSDMGAEVIKVESPSGDPIRALTTAGMRPGENGFTSSWEAYNRGKKSMILDLKAEAAAEILHRLLETADVFLTSLLPAARRKMRIDIADIKARHPNLIYAVGSGHGYQGPEAELGGYDSISFWNRAGVASSVTPDDMPHPLGQPSGAFGDCTSGAFLAGGICAALLQRERTGKVSIVDASLLASGMWSMQSHITAATLKNVPALPKRTRMASYNPLSNTYRVSDGRFIVLCMLQSQRYWPDLCVALGRPDLANDSRFATEEARLENLSECIQTLDDVFIAMTFDEACAALSGQRGQWGVVERPGDLHKDRQVLANGYMQDVDYGDGRSIKLVSAPVQFDRQPLQARPAPEPGAHTDAMLGRLGYDEDQIIDLKVAGLVF